MINFQAINDTLRTLAKAAAAEANKVKIKTAQDKTTKLQLENKRKTLDALRGNLVDIVKFFASPTTNPDIHATPETKKAAKQAAQFLYNLLSNNNVIGKAQQDPTVVAALNNDQFNATIALFHQVTQNFKRNQELKAIMNDQMNRLKMRNGQAYANALVEVNDLLDEENARLMSLGLNNNPSQTLTEINCKWAALLKRVFKVQGLVENKETAAPAKSANPFSQWGQNFFAAVSGLFKALNDPTQDSKGAQMNFIGSMIQMVVGLFANLFGRFLGKDAAPQVEELTKNVSGYFTNVLSEAYQKEDETKETAKKSSKNRSGSPITHAKDRHRSTAKTRFAMESDYPTTSSEDLSSSDENGYITAEEGEITSRPVKNRGWNLWPF